MRLFLFLEGDSFLHRLNPLTKMAFAGVTMLALTLIVDAVTSFVVAALTLAAISILGGVRPRALMRTLVPFGLVGLGVFWTTALFYVTGPGSSAHTLFTVGPFLVTDEGVGYGLAIMFRILGVFAASLLLVLTTDPTDFVQALVQRLHLSHRFGYGALAAYRFVPLFDSELATIRAAHRVRGVGKGGGPRARYRRFVGYLVPLLAGGVRKAERVALAMDARGFGAYPTRTFYRPSMFGPADLAFGVGSAAVLGGVLLVFHEAGWIGQLAATVRG